MRRENAGGGGGKQRYRISRMWGEIRERAAHNTERCGKGSDPVNDTNVIEGPKMDWAQGRAMMLSELNMTA
jgi:hypothetical protein